jgi:hypothetical protein
MTIQTASIPELAICRREPFALEMASLAALPSVRHAAPIPPLLLMALSAIEQTMPLFSREDALALGRAISTTRAQAGELLGNEGTDLIDRMDAAVAVTITPCRSPRTRRRSCLADGALSDGEG